MARLPKGMYKRGNRYYLRLWDEGRDRRVSLGSDLQEARRQARLLQNQSRSDVGQEAPASCLTVRKFSERWLVEYIRQNRNTAGQTLAEQRLNKHILPSLGALSLNQVSRTLIRGVRGGLEAKGLKTLTVRHVLSDIRCLLGYAVETGELPSSPFRASVMPKNPETVPRDLSEEQLTAVLAVIPDKYQTASKLAYLTGLRWSELRRLQWRHVIWGPKPHLVVEKTKSGKVRRVPLVPDALEVLQQERSKTKSVYVLPNRPEHTQVFVDDTRSVVGFHWTFHQLRHTFGRRFLEAGGNMSSLQKILGHSTISMTERYGHLSDDAVFAETASLNIGRPVNTGTVTGTLTGTVGDRQET